jgi:aldose 1-epimerase
MTAPTMVTIADGVAEASIVPELGAGLAAYHLMIGGRREPIFRPCRDPVEARPFDLALNLLAPWSNRISGGGFNFGSEFHPLEPNLPGEPLPIHGNAFSHAWKIESRNATSATLSLDSIGPGPFRYFARAAYELRGGALAVILTARNAGPKALPFGLGLHPWLPRTAETRLEAKAERVALENGDHLPDGELDVGAREDWNFATPRRLPEGWINNAFLGWNGRARIVWPERGLSLMIFAEAPISTYIVYSPAAKADFFCFEPVTHPVDAHNLPGGAEANGLIVLEPGREMSISCRFAPSAAFSLGEKRAGP